MGVQVASFLLFSWRCAQEENCKGLSPLLILSQNVFVVLKATVSSLHERTKYFRFGKTEHNLVELIRVAIWFWLLPGKSVFCPPTVDDKTKIGFRGRKFFHTLFILHRGFRYADNPLFPDEKQYSRLFVQNVLLCMRYIRRMKIAVC